LFVAAAAVLVLAALSSPAPAASGTWTGTASGNWSDIGNWSGTIADGATFTANLSTVDQTGNITVTIDGAVASRTLAILNIGDANNTNSYTIAGSGGGTLTLDNYGATAQLNQIATSKGDTLDATLPIRLASNLDISNASANALTVNGGISAIYAGAKIITNKGTGTGAVVFGGNVTDGTGRVYITQNSANSTLALTGTNTYTGWTIITAGILRAPGAGLSPNTWIQINGGVLESSGTIARNIGNTYRNVFWNNNGGFAAYGGDLTVTLNGGQTVDWANTTQGFNGKTLIFGSATATDKVTMTNNIALKAARTIQVNDNTGSANDMAEFSGILADGGTASGLTKTGTGVLVLSGANTYTGATTLSAGTLVLKNSIALQNSTLTMNGGGSSLVFDSSVVGNAFTFGGLAASAAGAGYNIALQNNAVSPAAVALTVGGNNAGTTYTGVLSGAGSLTKAGTGTLTLSGANTFTGGVTLSAGKLTLGHDNALGGAASTFTINNGGTLDVSAARTTPNNNPVTINGDFTFAGTNTLNLGTGAISLGTAGGTSRTITVNASTLTLAGVIANGSTANSLVKAGAGTLVLSGANTYTGPTNISAGTLTIGNVATFNNTSQIALTGTGRLDVNVANQSLAKLVTGGVPAGTFLRYSQAQTTAGAANGPGTILGTVELNITNVNPNYILGFGGGSKFTNTIVATYNSAITLSGDASIDSSTAVFTGGTGMTVSASTAGAKTLTLTGTNTGANTIGGIISNGSDTVGVAKTGAGAWAISGANAYTGSTDISAGTLTIGNAATFNNTSQIALSGTGRLDVNVANQSLAKLVTGGGVPAGTFLRYSQAQATGGTGPGTILGTVELNVTNVNPNYILDFGGGSKLTNTIAAIYTSGITLSGDASIDSSTAVFTGTGMTISASTAGAKTLTLTGTNTGANTIGGIISNGSDTVSVTKTGAGTWVLTGANTYTGATTVSAGVLRANNNVGLPGTLSAGGGSNLTINGGAFETGANLERAGGSGQGQMQITGGNSGFSANGAAVQVAFGTIGSPDALVWGAGSFQPATFILNASTANNTIDFKNAVNLGASARTVQVDAGAAYAATMSGVLSDSGGGLTKAGTGVLALSNTNTYTGVTTVNAGVLRLDSANALPGGIGASGGTSALTFNGGVVGLNAGDFTRPLAAAGTATGVNFTGNGGWAAYGADRVVNLGGAWAQVVWANANTGFNARTVILGNSSATHKVTLQNSLDLGNAVRTVQVDDGTAAVDAELSGIFSGAGGGLTKTGAGTLLLSNGANGYTGVTTVSAGVLLVSSLADAGVVSNIGAYPTAGAAGLVLGGGTFRYTGGSTSINRGLTLSAASTIDVNTAGTALTLGNCSLGAFALNVTGGAGSSLTLGAVTVTGAATLNPTTADLIVPSVTGTNLALTLGGTSSGNQVTGVIATGTGGLTKSGAGTWTLLGANTYTGVTTVSAGVLSVSSIENIGVPSNIGAYPTAGAAGLVLSGGTLRYTGGTKSVDRGLTLSAASTIDVNTASTALTLGNCSLGAFALNVTGGAGSSLTLGAVTVTGAATLSPTTADLIVPSVTGTNLALTLGGTSTGSQVTGIIATGTGTLTKSGAGTWALTGANTYTGATTVSAGVLNVRNATGLGTTAAGTTVSSGAALELQGGITVGAEALSIAGTGISSGGALRNVSGSNTYGGLVTQTAASRINSDSGTLTLDVAAGNSITGTFNLTLGGAGNITVADPIAITTGTLTKDGSGTLTLSAVNTYSGTTTVTAGTLKVSGSINSSDVTVSNAGSVLSGGGSVKSLTVNSAAIVAPGDGVGTLAVATGGFATLNSGAVYQWELGSVSADLVNIAGNLTLDNAWTLKLVDAGGTPVVSTQYNLFTYTGTYTGLATFGLSNIDVSGVSWNTTGASIVAGGGVVYITGIGPSGMGAPAIPEPGTAMLVIFGAAALLRRRRVAEAA
jgi:autotransporter-associated beta strand protein